MPVNNTGNGCIQPSGQNTPALEWLRPGAQNICSVAASGIQSAQSYGVAVLGSECRPDSGIHRPVIQGHVIPRDAVRIRLVGTREPSTLGGATYWRVRRSRLARVDGTRCAAPRRAKSCKPPTIADHQRIGPCRSRQAVRISPNGGPILAL